MLFYFSPDFGRFIFAEISTTPIHSWLISLEAPRDGEGCYSEVRLLLLSHSLLITRYFQSNPFQCQFLHDNMLQPFSILCNGSRVGLRCSYLVWSLLRSTPILLVILHFYSLLFISFSPGDGSLSFASSCTAGSYAAGNP